MSDPTPEPSPFRPPKGEMAPEDPSFLGWGEGKLPKRVVKRNRRRLLLLLSAALVLGVAAILSARPAYRWVKGWRGRHLAAESLQLSAAGKASEAAQKAQAAYRLAPGDPLPLRAFATALAAAGRGGPAAAAWEQLVQRGDASSEDRVALIEAHLQARQFIPAREHLEKLVALSGESARTALFSARLKLARGEEMGALEAARRALELAPEDDTARIMVGGLKMKSAATAREGEAELLALGAKPTPAGLRALSVLASAADLSIEATEKVAAALERHPLAKEGNHLNALELRWRAEPARRDALLDAAQDRYSEPGTDPAIRSELAALLLRLAAPERVLRFLPRDQALTRQEWLTLHLDALSMLHRWEEIAQVLEKGVQALPVPITELYRARCYEELGEPEKGSLHWSRGLAEAGGNSSLLLHFAEYAEKQGKAEKARSAYRALRQVPEAARFAQQRLASLGEKEEL